jgi:hypothetical protein
LPRPFKASSSSPSFLRPFSDREVSVKRAEARCVLQTLAISEQIIKAADGR